MHQVKHNSEVGQAPLTLPRDCGRTLTGSPRQ